MLQAVKVAAILVLLDRLTAERVSGWGADRHRTLRLHVAVAAVVTGVLVAMVLVCQMVLHGAEQPTRYIQCFPVHRAQAGMATMVLAALAVVEEALSLPK
jgi:hypothetical protein